MTGFINVIKPKGMSSALAVHIVKKKTGLPAGHMGTLDPMASGVLPIGLGKASRLFQYMLDKEKEYIATFKFGLLTDTLDVTGKVIEKTDYIPSEEEIRARLKELTGEILQVPPAYSAKCINGKRGYELARRGIEFDLKPKSVNVLSFSLEERVSEDEFRFRIICKGGTYVRSLARDLGNLTGSLAVMSALDRRASGVFNYSNGVEIDQINLDADLNKYLIAPENTLSFEKIYIDSQREKKILDGVFENIGVKNGIYSVFGESGFIGVGEGVDGVLRIKSYVKHNG